MLTRLAGNNKTLFETIRDFIKRIKSIITKNDVLYSDINNAETLFEKVYRELAREENRKYKTGDDVKLSLKNKNINSADKIPYINHTSYINVRKNDNRNLKNLQNRVKNIQRGTYENKATGYKADINSQTIGKILHPTFSSKFHPWDLHYIENLNASLYLPKLFENAVYIDSFKNQKQKNINKASMEFHHFVAPIRMNNQDYRVRIVAREKPNSDVLYIVDSEVLKIKGVTTSPNIMKNTMNSNSYVVTPDISISDLVDNINIFDYNTGNNQSYSDKDLKFSLKEENVIETDTEKLLKQMQDKFDKQQEKFDKQIKALEEEVRALRGEDINKKEDVNSRLLNTQKSPENTSETTFGFNSTSSNQNISQDIKESNEEIDEQNEIVRADSESISDDDIKVIKKDYENAVDEGLIRYIENINKGKKVKPYHNIGNVSNELIEDVEKLTGLDITGYKNSIDSIAVEHIWDRHGENGEANESMSDINDIARIGYVIDNYDSIKLGDKKSVRYFNKDKSRADSIILTKRINGYYEVVEAVPDTKNKLLRVDTAYKYKNKKQLTNYSNAENNPQYTSETSFGNLASYNQSIPQNRGKNNENTVYNAGSERYIFDEDGNVVRIEVMRNPYTNALDREVLKADFMEQKKLPTKENLEQTDRGVYDLILHYILNILFYVRWLLILFCGRIVKDI
ncbi:hypothetical protein [Anaerofustis stercorihominis]|uniref:LPD3 domain-containing protein n=1 Tax=Anaerofustis stercorihominis TaxID=214853 RepID=UPI001106380E|nr:hypothetical protein [Anaerofustis stercorihominis]